MGSRNLYEERLVLTELDVEGVGVTFDYLDEPERIISPLEHVEDV